jgi:ANTAR domain
MSHRWWLALWRGPSTRPTYPIPRPRGERVATKYSPAAVHIAIGVLMELHDCDPPQAIAMLSSSALSTGRTITDLALEIIDDPTGAAVGEQQLGGY